MVATSMFASAQNHHQPVFEKCQKVPDISQRKPIFLFERLKISSPLRASVIKKKIVIGKKRMGNFSGNFPQLTTVNLF